MAERNDGHAGDRLLIAALSAFHVTVLMTALFAYLQSQGDVGRVLGDLNSAVGNGVYLWLAITTTWATYRAMREHAIAFPEQDPLSYMWLRGVLWSSVNGAVFYAGLLIAVGVFGFAFSLADPWPLDASAALQSAAIFAAYFLFGMLPAALVGAIVGIVITTVDLVALAAGRRLATGMLDPSA